MLDVTLLTWLGAVLLQTVPLPGTVAATLSPESWPLQTMLHMDPVQASWPLSIDAGRTRVALTQLAAAVLLFWAAREAFSCGGVRVAARTIAWTGLAVTLVALAGRATAPLLVLWRWRAPDPGSQPFGPFVNPNHFATWLVMAGGLTAGYLVAHRRSHRSDHSSRRLLLRDWLADGSGLILASSLGMMMLGLAATLSRAAIIGAVVAVAATTRLHHGGRATRRGLHVAAAIVAAGLAAAVWTNREGIERKFTAATTVSRVTIWRETLPVIGDFWLTGTGAGTYSRAMLRYQQTNPDAHFNQAHSEYVQLLAEGGLLLAGPTILAAAVWLALARRRLQSERHELFWIRAGAAAGILAVTVQAAFETGIRVPANGLLLAVLAAIVVHEPRTPRDSVQMTNQTGRA